MNISSTLSLYVHLPWCIKKCPYCDFNSHELRSNPDEDKYIKALLTDLAFELKRFDVKPAIKSIFIGGGTPSLFSGTSIDKLLTGIEKHCELTESIEITLEANPGTADEARFNGYRKAGINRLSLGIQSFNDQHLKSLGRIHDSRHALTAIEMADGANFTNINLDMMYCLPEQTPAQASQDIIQAIALAPTHISAYHLTLEPNTLFAVRPPVLPDEETGWQIQQDYWAALDDAGYSQYEISAYCKSNQHCRHNLNYWQFGDYLGIGAGAHGKITRSDGVYRTCKPKHPTQYMKAFTCLPEKTDDYLKLVDKSELPVQYMMNMLRLKIGFSLDHFEQSTGVNRSQVADELNQALTCGLLIQSEGIYRPSEKGRLFLDDLLQLFIPNPCREVA